MSAEVLKPFSVEKGDKPGTLNVQCPQTRCGFKFVVGRAWLKGWKSKEGVIYKTASCPNCFRVARRVRP